MVLGASEESPPPSARRNHVSGGRGGPCFILRGALIFPFFPLAESFSRCFRAASVSARLPEDNNLITNRSCDLGFALNY